MKRLVVCADGTWSTTDVAAGINGTARTNVAKLADAIAPRDAAGVAQEVYYHPGTGRGWWWDRAAGAFGFGLARSVKDCYAWLVDRYEPGDELFVFGFSRGAYTARCLVGLIRNCGVLHWEHDGLIDKAYEFYRDRRPETHPAGAQAADFRARYAQPGPVVIKCVGVWDTVGALGVPVTGPLGRITRKRYGFHDLKLTSWVENAFHVLAIDERRKPFEPTLWEVAEAECGRPTFKQRVEQVWFPGVHANVGGGYPDGQLSDLTLAWMFARASECGLAIKPEAKASVRGHCCGTLYDSMTWYYRAMGGLTRSVNARRKDAKGDPVRTFERVDPSAFERRRKYEPKYDPENLRGFAETALH
jgi:uncharacterized protein (DUF2235 family)